MMYHYVSWCIIIYVYYICKHMNITLQICIQYTLITINYYVDIGVNHVYLIMLIEEFRPGFKSSGWVSPNPIFLGDLKADLIPKCDIAEKRMELTQAIQELGHTGHA